MRRIQQSKEFAFHSKRNGEPLESLTCGNPHSGGHYKKTNKPTTGCSFRMEKMVENFGRL